MKLARVALMTLNRELYPAQDYALLSIPVDIAQV
jgi:hypothetical protein